MTKMGRAKFTPTKEQILTVRIMSACGMPQQVICQHITNGETGNPVALKTLRLAFRDELNSGKSVANAIVAQSLFKKATSGTGQGAVTAAIFWLKTQAGWKETNATELVHSGNAVTLVVSGVKPDNA